MIKQHITYKFKLEPAQAAEDTLKQWCGISRFVYNLGLEHRITNWNQFKKSENFYSQCNQLKDMKRCEGYEWLSIIPAQCLQQSLKDLDKAYRHFFKNGSGFPKFKKAGRSDSLRFPEPKDFKIERVNGKWGLIRLPKGLTIKFHQSRHIVGDINFVTVKRHYDGWYLCIDCTKEIDIKPSTKSIVGIDRGITESLVCTSDNGTEVFNIPAKAKAHQERARILQKRVSRKKKFSRNWYKAQAKFRKHQCKVTNIRKDFLHKASTCLSKNHGLIRIEDLNIAAMSKSASGTVENPGTNVSAKSGLNREIRFQGWGIFEVMLKYKTEWNGGAIELVNPRYTSQTCSKCGHKERDNRKGKSFKCLSCGFSEDADVNASINIKNTAGRAERDCGGVGVNQADEAVTKTRMPRKRKSV